MPRFHFRQKSAPARRHEASGGFVLISGPGMAAAMDAGGILLQGDTRLGSHLRKTTKTNK